MTEKENSSSMANQGGHHEGVMTFSPIKSTTSPKVSAAHPVLLCAKFQESLYVDFENVALKSTKFINFSLKNPDHAKSVSITLEPLSDKSELIVSLGSTKLQNVIIAPQQEVMATALWTPVQEGSMREVVRLRLDDKAALQVVVQGTGVAKVDASFAKKRMSAKPDQLARKKSDGKLVVKTVQQSAQDEQWAEKQSSSFLEWINFVFAQSQGAGAQDASAKPEEAAESEEPLALADFLQHQRDARVRQRAVTVFRSRDTAIALAQVEREVDAGKLSLREDRDVLADLGLQEALFGILFSYDLAWLRLALEVVFCKSLPCAAARQRPRSVQRAKATLRAFVAEHLLSDADTVAQFPRQSAFYQSHEKRLRSLLGKHFLKKFLAVVLFLDVGRRAQLLPVAALFARESIYKSSRDVLNSFCRCFLRGEGDLMRHLSLVGFQVGFAQAFVDEFDFLCANLAADLRDGVRLARLVDLLTGGATNLTAQLRVPAVSRLQKLHNVGLVLAALDGAGVEARHVVDGHRGQTLVLLWRVMSAFELRGLVDAAAVRAELRAIRSNESWRRSVYYPREAAGMAVRVLAAGEPQGQPAGCADQEADDESTLPDLLLQWCQAVAEPYEVPVLDLTRCLADGRALCLLVHHYHPAVLPTRAIKKTTANLPDAANSSAADLQRALNGERRNYLTLRKACRDIGGVPLLVGEFDSRRPPEERSMLALLSYLFVRLTESAEQVRAAIRLQRAFRKRAGVAPAAVLPAPCAAAPAPAVEPSAEPEAEATDPATDDEAAVGALPEVEPIEDASAAELTQLAAANRCLEGQLAEETRERIKAELAAKLEVEKQLLLSLELRVLEVSEETRLRASLAQGAAAELAQQAETQRHQDALLAAELLAHERQEAQLRAEDSLRESEAANAREQLAAQELARQRAELEQRLLEEQRQHYLDLQRARAEEEQLRGEREARLRLEDEMDRERLARERVEEQMLQEVQARLALEVKLRALEQQALSEAAEQSRRALAAKVEAFARARAVRVIGAALAKCVLQTSRRRTIRGLALFQATFRGNRARRVARCAMLAVQILQSTWRRKQCAKMLVRMNAGALVVQRAWRAHSAVVAKRKRSAAGAILQRWWRARLDRVSFLVLLSTVASVQATVRSRQQRRRFCRALLAVRQMQRAARRMIRQRRAAAKASAAQTIARCCRAALARWRRDYEYGRKRAAEQSVAELRQTSGRKIAAFVLAAWARMRRVKAADAVGRWFRSCLPVVRVRKLTSGFRRLAAFYRALRVRRKSSKALAAQLERIRAAEARARADPSLKLGKQTTAALRTLQTGKMISHVLKACQTLELSTQLSRRCCEAFAHAQAADILFTLLRSCNRSTPHQELLRIALVILLNVARHRHLAEEVARVADSADFLVDLLQTFRDKKTLFILAAELLTRLVDASAESKNSCNSPVLRKRLEGILHIMERKNRLEVRVKAVGDLKSRADCAASHASPAQAPNQFDRYRGKAYRLVEPITCVHHLMQLLASE